MSRRGNAGPPDAASMRRVAWLAAVGTLGFAAVVVGGLGTPWFQLVVDDVGEAVASGFAALLCWRAARVAVGRQRRAWLALAAGCLGWTLGEIAWSVEEIVLDVQPFPSLADIGFLTFPLGAIAGLLLFGGDLHVGQRIREVVDGLLAALGLFVVSWATVLGPLTAASDSNGWELTVSVAYPALDVAVGALLLLALSRATATGRRPLRLLAAGLAALAVADSAFAYLSVAGDYGVGSYLDVGWFVGFVLIGVAAATAGGGEAVTTAEPIGSVRRDLLPSAPLVLCAGVLAVSRSQGRAVGSVVELSIVLLALLLVARQVLTMTENVRLMAEVRAREIELRWRAFHDSLTGLANRALLRDRAEHALDRATSGTPLPALLFLDLDDFKHVNDKHGHSVGDALLVEVADRLRTCVRRGDTVARLGGDEFAVLVEPATAVDIVSARVLDALSTPFQLEGAGVLRISGSIGLAVAEPLADVDELLAAADVAMYAAKQAGKGRLESYAPGMRLQGEEEVALRAELLTALTTRSLGVAYQPVIGLEDGHVVGVEALARWTHPELGPVSPGVFVPLAERQGLIHQLDTLVLDSACAQLVRWDAQLGTTRLSLAVNLSAAYLAEHALPEQIREVLARHRIAPNRVVLEITESALLRDVESAVEVVRGLKALGVGIAIDDFGTGWSSMAYLHRFPVDLLKIDRSFIADLAGDGARIVSVIVQMAQTLGLATVAEGLENIEQAPLLREIGCDLVQGYAVGVPGNADQVTRAVLRGRVRGLHPLTLPRPRAGSDLPAARSDL